MGKFLIPKFRIIFDFKASDLLKGIGLRVRLPFCAGDLTEMVDDSSELFASEVFHKSFIEVYEEVLLEGIKW